VRYYVSVSSNNNDEGSPLSPTGNMQVTGARMHTSFPRGPNVTTTLSKVPWTIQSKAQSTWTVLGKQACHVPATCRMEASRNFHRTSIWTVRSNSIHMDRPIKILFSKWHAELAATCQMEASRNFLNQSVFDICDMCHYVIGKVEIQ
jgi:hypothetical protein